MTDKIKKLQKDIRGGVLKFTDVLAFIDTYYEYKPVAFKNGDFFNEKGDNPGSARIFSFARLNGFSEKETLELFAEHYTSVSRNPEGTGHQNIRQFMTYGWPGIFFEGKALKEK